MADLTIPALQDKIKILFKNSIPENAHRSILNGAIYFEQASGVSISEYWKSEKFDNRDEFFVALNSYYGLIGAMNKLVHKNEWRLKFDVAYLFQLKANAQSALALNLLTEKHCYTDAFSVCRTMISRLNLTMLCALNPELFNQWLKNPNDKKFTDGNIRNELYNVGISTVPHLYRLTSDIIHSQFMGLTDVGYFEVGLFPSLPPINNQIWVIGKFLIGMTYNVILSMALQDNEGHEVPEGLKIHQELLGWLKENYFVSNRLDHLWTFVAEERHWIKKSETEQQVGTFYDFNEIPAQIKLFYSSGIKKQLSAKYNV